MKNILLIGLGYHARRIYFPVLQEFQKNKLINKIFVIDLESQQAVIKNYLHEKKSRNIETIFFEKPLNLKLSKGYTDDLNNLIKKENIKGIIIATEPLAHMVYAEWALKNRLSVLMDKPISTREWIVCDEKYGKHLIFDYNKLAKMYAEARRDNPRIVFAMMAQRRFHNAFKKMKEAIKEVYEYTNCPITSIQSFHSDGQWRFPTEIIEQTAHPYNQGYGKCSHSGYHFFDIVSWLMEGSDKVPDEMEVVNNFLTPKDFINQYGFDDYRKNFKDFDKYNRYSEKEFTRIARDFGEIDSFNNFTFRKNGKVITLVSINLCHNGFSQRNWTSTIGRDLYKGNGRVRHESHYIIQGPFQAISYLSYQSKEVNPKMRKHLFDVGGEYHADIYIFRNSTFNPQWKCVSKFQVKDMIKRKMKDKNRGHQEDARREAIAEFLDNIATGSRKISEQSDLTQYERSVKMMSGAYQSMARRRKGLNPLVKINL